MLKKEADYFVDIVILMDRFQLIVRRTIVISEYGVQNMTVAYIMKCDVDTFVRVDTVLKEFYFVPHKKSLYMGVTTIGMLWDIDVCFDSKLWMHQGTVGARRSWKQMLSMTVSSFVTSRWISREFG